MCEGVLFNANAAIHQLQLLWREQVNEMMLRSAWNYTNTLSVIFFYSAISLKQHSADKHVAPIGHIILIPSQPAFALSPNAACLAKKQQIPIL